MRHPSLARRALAAVSIAAAVWSCSDREPPDVSTPRVTPEPVASAEEPAVPAEPETPEAPPFDPSPPALELESPTMPEAQPSGVPAVPARTPKVPARRSAEPSITAPAKAEPEHPSLDALFRAPYVPSSESDSVDLARPGSVTAPNGPKPPRALDRLGDSIRLERRGEAIGPAGPRQGTAWETDAGVRIPVDKSISLEGGVRVESREEPGVKQKEEARRTPKVGVEVRF